MGCRGIFQNTPYSLKKMNLKIKLKNEFYHNEFYHKIKS
ncbi:hypothetical protein HPCPY1313_0497 [Helicobacter pylori CPY1313]|nr:hypothetical protein HPCPY1313_0497 [Helicobacter pylori CPY1313]